MTETSTHYDIVITLMVSVSLFRNFSPDFIDVYCTLYQQNTNMIKIVKCYYKQRVLLEMLNIYIC